MTLNAPGLILFDCDGVLVDSELITNRVFTQMINEIGLPLTRAEVLERFVGRAMSYCFAQLEEMRRQPLPEGFEAAYRERSHAALRSELQPVPHVDSVLDELDARGIAYAVASGGTHEKMQTTLGVTGLLLRFDGRLFSSTEVPNGKPAPDVYLHAARRLQVAPAQCYVVEDTAVGVSAGVAAGMRVYGYAGLTPAQSLKNAGAYRTVSDMRELIGLWFGD